MKTAIELFDRQLESIGFLQAYDPDYGNDTVTGDVTVIDDIREALLFDSIADAVAFAMQQSTRVPLRPDGQPNRPITAFTIEFRPAVGVADPHSASQRVCKRCGILKRAEGGHLCGDCGEDI